MDRQGAVATLRAAVAAFVSDHATSDERWCVALSGGADSLALTSVAAASKPTTGLIVDPRLHPASGRGRSTPRAQALLLAGGGARARGSGVGRSGWPPCARPAS